KNVAYSRNQRSSECRIEKMLLAQLPGNQFLRLIFPILDPQSLRDSVGNLIRIRQGGIRIEANQPGKIVDPGNHPICRLRLNSVFEFSSRIHLVKNPFERRQPEIQRELSVVAYDRPPA